MHDEHRRDQLLRDLSGKSDREVAVMAYVGMWFHIEKCDQHSKMLARIGWGILSGVITMVVLKIGDMFHFIPAVPGVTH